MHDDKLNTWFTFLEDECDGDNGLFCFYDAKKSHKAAFFCLVLANEMTAFLGKDSSIDEVYEESD
jgi:hypothetical protein